MPVFILTSLLSLLNMCLFCISNFRKTKKGILYFHIGCNLCDIFMYILLDAKTGLANGITYLCKNMAFAKYNSEFFLVVFAVLRVVLLCLGYEGYVTLVFIFLEIASTFTLLYGSVQSFRVLTFSCQVVWVVYDYLFAGIIVVTMTFIDCVFCLIALIKNWKLPKEVEQEA